MSDGMLTVRLPQPLLVRAKAYAILFDLTLEGMVEDALVDWTNARIPQAKKKLASLKKGRVSE